MEHGPIKVGMVILMQPDLNKAVEFYKDKLGLPLQFHLENKWAEFDLGCVKFGLCPVEAKQEATSSGIVLETQEDLVSFYEKMKSEIEFLGEPVVAVHGIMVGIKDPGGNIIDMYQATPENINIKEFVEQAHAPKQEEACCDEESCQDEQEGCCDDENSDACC